MENESYIAMNFDLDTKKLIAAYPNKSYKNAYADIKKVFADNGFEHRQGSGYVSKEKCADTNIFFLISELQRRLPWIKDSINRLDVTQVSKPYDLTHYIKSQKAKCEKIHNFDAVQDHNSPTNGKTSKFVSPDAQREELLKNSNKPVRQNQKPRRSRDNEMER